MIVLLAVGLAGAVVVAALVGAIALSALVIGLVTAPILLVAWFLLRSQRDAVQRPAPPRTGPVIETDYRDVTDEKR